MRHDLAAASVTLLILPAIAASVMAAQLASGPYEGPKPPIYRSEAAPATPELESLPKRQSISQYGITWTFETEAPVGRFITGDWYVVGPVTVAAVTPRPLFGREVGDRLTPYEERFKDTAARNGSVLNPKLKGIKDGAAPFDSRVPHHVYKPDQFAAPPIAMKPGDALYSTISKPNDAIDVHRLGNPHVRVIRAGAILTCVAEPLPPDAFRPALHDRLQTIYLSRNLKRELLYSLPRPRALPQAGTTPQVDSWGKALERWARIFQRPWVDLDQWGWVNPEDNMPEYGQWVTHAASIAALVLHLDIPPEDWYTLSNEGYRRCCTGKNWAGECLAARLMRAEKIWNHKPFFDYTDRWMSEDHIAELKRIVEGLQKNHAVPEEYKDVVKRSIERRKKEIARFSDVGYPRTDDFQQEMWDTHRNNLPPAKKAGERASRIDRKEYPGGRESVRNFPRLGNVGQGNLGQGNVDA
jgi:hypothetical protein